MKYYAVQKNRLKLNSSEKELVEKLSLHCTKLYNVGLYSIRQYYFDNDAYLPYAQNYHVCKYSEHYKLLLTGIGQQILKIADRNIKSFFSLLKLYKEGKYSSEVKLPKYKKSDSFSMICIQGRDARIKGSKIHIGFSKKFKEEYSPNIKELIFDLPRNVKVEILQEVRIIPKYGGKEWDIEFTYKKEIEPKELNQDNFLSIDLGLDNFATTFDSTNGSSFIICGRYIKSINQWYNKEKARLQSIKDKQGYTHWTKRLIHLERKREFRINDFFNRVVKKITDYCIDHDIGSIVIGDFKNIKQDSNLGKVNNQNFGQIPYWKFKQKLSSKCTQLGIKFNKIEESYTSKTSFLDKEEPKKQEYYKGTRIRRGLFKTFNQTIVNSDKNGASQILIKFLYKSKPELINYVYQQGLKGFANNPVRYNIYKKSSLLPTVRDHSDSFVLLEA